MVSVVDKLFPAIKEDIRKKMLDEIKKYGYNIIGEENLSKNSSAPKAPSVARLKNGKQGENNKEA
jgi:hypothetical protein